MAMLALAAVLSVLAIAAWRLVNIQRSERALAVPALIAISAILAHSWVDYPLRTPALMLVAALLAGVVVSTAARVAADRGRDPDGGMEGGRGPRQAA